MSETPNGSNGAANEERVEMHIDEAIARYYGEWVLMKVTEIDEHHDVMRGVIIAHAPSRQAISDALALEPPRDDRPGAPYRPYYPFYARPRTHHGESIEQAWERFQRQRATALAARP